MWFADELDSAEKRILQREKTPRHREGRINDVRPADTKKQPLHKAIRDTDPWQRFHRHDCQPGN